MNMFLKNCEAEENSFELIWTLHGNQLELHQLHKQLKLYGSLMNVNSGAKPLVLKD